MYPVEAYDPYVELTGEIEFQDWLEEKLSSAETKRIAPLPPQTRVTKK